MKKRTLTMDWDGLGEDDDDDDRFFESRPRISTANSCSESEGEDFEDSRMSFASTFSSASMKSLRPVNSFVKPQAMSAGYDMWISEPGDIRERRRRLLQGMGLASNKNMMRIASNRGMERIASNRGMVRIASRKLDEGGIPPPIDNGEILPVKVESRPMKETIREEEPPTAAPSPSPSPYPSPPPPPPPPPPAPSSPSPSRSHPTPILLVKSRSYGDMVAFSAKAKKREDELIGSVSKQRLTRTSSEVVVPSMGVNPYSSNSDRTSQGGAQRRSSNSNNNELQSDSAFHPSLLFKNLDTGKEFVMEEYDEHGLCKKVSDVQTGKQLTMDEFEMSAGSSPVVRELMGRQDLGNGNQDSRKLHHSYLSKRFTKSKKKGAAFLKNIKDVATSMRYDHKEQQDNSTTEDHKAPAKDPSKWVKTRQHGKSHREFTALHMTQDIQAHEGSIWSIKFNWDAHLLATAGEDKVIHVWEVQECEVMCGKSDDASCSASTTPAHPTASGPLAEITPLPSDKWKMIKNYRKKCHSMPSYVNLPDTVFSLSEKPICSLEGHEEDVLDLSWSKSQLLLSSSMDKTVRLWDVETKTCLKSFPHNDYVTCIQFNPVDNNYFMSGSLDAKVRIWNIPDRQVVDWIDLNEMVTAATYTPDGQGAVVGSQQGNCRFYSIDDCKLECGSSVRMRTKAQTKKLPGFHHHSQPLTNKITGFQYFPSNPSEVLITSTDSRIRLHNGSELIQKYRGFRNTSSQIAAAISPDGRYVICASEDSQVYIWKVEESKIPGETGMKKNRVTVLAHEYFYSKEVTIAIPWPGSIRYQSQIAEANSKRHSKRSSSSDQDGSLSGSGGMKQHFPPIPSKKHNESNTEEDSGQSGRMDPPGIGVSSSFDSSSSPSGCAESSSPHSCPSSKGEKEGGGGGGGGRGNKKKATAWGMVIVTANVDGEIKVYQNFGLPLKVGRL